MNKKQLKYKKRDDLTAQVKAAKVVVLTDYTGLKVSQINDLRTKIKAVGGNYEVVKNTLLRAGLGLTKESDSPLLANLNGPTAALFAIEDESAPLKVLVQFSKATSIPAIKGGLMGDKFLTPEEVTKLAMLPSREILVGKLLGLLNAPVTNLLYVLQGNTSKLVRVLAEISKNKSN